MSIVWKLPEVLVLLKQPLSPGSGARRGGEAAVPRCQLALENRRGVPETQEGILRLLSSFSFTLSAVIKRPSFSLSIS